MDLIQRSMEPTTILSSLDHLHSPIKLLVIITQDFAAPLPLTLVDADRLVHQGYILVLVLLIMLVNIKHLYHSIAPT